MIVNDYNLVLPFVYAPANNDIGTIGLIHQDCCAIL